MVGYVGSLYDTSTDSTANVRNEYKDDRWEEDVKKQNLINIGGFPYSFSFVPKEEIKMTNDK